MGSLQTALKIYAEQNELKHGIDNIESLFPDFKAVLYTAAPEAGETAEEFAARFAAEVKADIKTESNLRGGAEYRRHLAGVLTKRAVGRLEG